MTVTEINPIGNFDTWPKKLLNEVARVEFSLEVGKLLFESDTVKFWEITLEPGERIPFRYHLNNFGFTCFTDGLMVVRNINGRVTLVRFNKGDHYFVEYDSTVVNDAENIGESVIKIAVVEEKIAMPF